MRGSKAILWLSLACAACGKSNTLADANSADANRTDAGNTIDADAHGPVTVITLSPDGVSGPLMGVPVVFQEPDGELAAEVTTDATGKATADVLPGATVTAVFVIDDTQHDLETVTGVKPGDTITIGTAFDNTIDGTFTVNLIDVVGTEEYDVYGPCGVQTFTPAGGSGSGTTFAPNGVVATDPVLLTIANGCKESTMDLVAVRMVGGEPIDYVELADTPYAASGSVTQTAAWTPVVTDTFDYTNIPADVTNINAEPNVPDYWGDYTDVIAPINGTTASTTAIMPLAKTAEVITTLGGNSGGQEVIEVVDGTKTTYSLDVGASLLPWLAPPMLDVTTAKVATPTQGTGNGDAFRVIAEFQRAAAGGSGSGSATVPTTYDWIVWSASIGDVTLPTLPTDVADNNPLPTDTVTNSGAFVFDLDLATGYDAVRPYLDAAENQYFNAHGVTGKLRGSYSQNPATGRAHGGGKGALLRAQRHQSRRVHVAHRPAAAR